MRLRRLALAAALVGCFGTSCDKKPDTAVVVPDEGVTMRYDLTPGQTYAGHINQKTIIETQMGNVEMRLEYDVALLVTGATSPDGPLLAATFNNIKANAIMPGGIPPAAAGFDPKVAGTLNGVELRFNMTDGGELENMPELPEGQPPAIVAIMSQLTGGLQSAFTRLPDEPLKEGEEWSRERDEDGTTSTMSGKLKKLRANSDGDMVATLDTESSGKMKREVEGKMVEGSISGLSTISFVSSAGFASSLDRKLRRSTNMADIRLEFEVTWEKGEKTAVEVQGEVQAVTDPCDADYVGGEECPADGGEQQAITDPCDADYVGGEECPADAAGAPAPAAAAE
ncbi:MAG: hypothetical protein ACRBN8_33495 [Nannocystales bacterium]